MVTPGQILKAPILIVETEETLNTLLIEMLRSAGYVQVSSTTDSATVVELQRKHRFDLILLAVDALPLDGLQVLEKLRRLETKDAPPILATGAQAGDAPRARQAGARSYLTRPYARDDVLARVQDAIEIRLARRESRVLEEQVETAHNNLESFSYSLSHDLRAPLRHILGFADLLILETGPGVSERQRRYLSTISQSARLLGKLIDDLLAFSRCGNTPLRATRVNLEALVQDTLRDFAKETQERNVAWNILPLPAVRADPALLRVVLGNLMSNAVKFTGPRAEAKIEIGCQAKGAGETVIYVRDNGVGFDPQYAGKLFNVCQRLHSHGEFPGSGIGLANVKRIIERHGGRTWAEGVMDGGACFYFSFPSEQE